MADSTSAPADTASLTSDCVEGPTLRPMASIYDCERLAINSDGFDRATFDLVGPWARLKAQWLDAHMGILQVEGEGGFCMSRDFDSPDIWCENFALPIKENKHDTQD